MSFERYQAGIERAKQEGLIDERFHPIACDYDIHSHLIQFSGSNSRFVDPVTKILLEKIREVKGKLKILVLGAEAGVEVAEIGSIFPQAEIDTVGLTPINPYFHFSCDILLAPERDESVTKTINTKTGMERHDFILDELVNAQVVFGFNVFEECDSPFIHHQTIDKFPCDLPNSGNGYDFVYERMGPIFHADTFMAPTMVSSTEALLHDEGMMSVSPSYYQRSDSLCYVEVPNLRVELARLFIIKPGHPLAQKIKEKSRQSKGRNVISLQDLTEL